MKSIVRAALAAAAIVLAPAVALAQSTPPPPAPAAPAPQPAPAAKGTDIKDIIGQVSKAVRPLAVCKGDVEKLCPGIAKGETRKCLNDNAAKLSPECSAAIDELQGKVKAMRQACKEDVKTLCAASAKGAAIVQCIRENRDKVSPACATAFDARYPRNKS